MLRYKNCVDCNLRTHRAPRAVATPFCMCSDRYLMPISIACYLRRLRFARLKSHNHVLCNDPPMPNHFTGLPHSGLTSTALARRSAGFSTALISSDSPVIIPVNRLVSRRVRVGSWAACAALTYIGVTKSRSTGGRTGKTRSRTRLEDTQSEGLEHHGLRDTKACRAVRVSQQGIHQSGTLRCPPS